MLCDSSSLPSPYGAPCRRLRAGLEPERLGERAAHVVDLLLAHRSEERQREAARPRRLGHREVARPEAEPAAIERLQMDRREVGARRDAARLELADQPV